MPLKEDVLINLSIELEKMFGILTNLYSRPEFLAGLPELEKIEAYLKSSLAEYTAGGNADQASG